MVIDKAVLFIVEGVIVYCGMVEGSINYLMFVENQDSQIIDQYIVYSWLRLNLLTVVESRKA